MTPYELSELREKQDAAEHERDLEAEARRVMPAIAGIYKKRGLVVPSPRKLLEQARAVAWRKHELLNAEIKEAVKAAVGTPPQILDASSARLFVESQIEREAALLKLETILGAEIEGESRVIRRMAETFLDWNIWYSRAAQLAGIGRASQSGVEDALRIAGEMKGEWGQVDPEAYVAGLREEMGLPPESEASSN
jgi:hypothetical protein